MPPAEFGELPSARVTMSHSHDPAHVPRQNNRFSPVPSCCQDALFRDVTFRLFKVSEMSEYLFKDCGI